MLLGHSRKLALWRAEGPNTEHTEDEHWVKSKVSYLDNFYSLFLGLPIINVSAAVFLQPVSSLCDLRRLSMSSGSMGSIRLAR